MPLTPEQIALRKTGICASEISAIAGLNPYRRAIDVFAEKLDLVEPFAGNRKSQWGDMLEAVLADTYAKEHAQEKIVLRSPGTLIRPATSRLLMIATPDRLVFRKRHSRPFRNLQIKTAGLRQEDKWGASGTDDVPEHYLVQCAWEMAVADVEMTHLMVLIGGQDDRVYPLYRDRELEGQLIEVAEKFWVDHIKTGMPPPVDGTDQYSEYLKKRFPRDTRPMLPATEVLESLVRQLRNTRLVEKDTAAEVAELENQIKVVIGDAGGIEGLCTWRQNKPSEVTDWEKVACSLPCAMPDFIRIVKLNTTTKPGARPFKLAKEK